MNHLAKKEEKRRLEKLESKAGSDNWCSVAYRNDKRGGVLKKAYPYSTNHKNMKKWFRRLSNRKFRRGKNENEELLNGNQHKKKFDLWWSLY